jgi:plasmid stabilization system protein ParE
MAYRLRLSARAIREIGEAYGWYEAQLPGLGLEFLKALDGQFDLLTRTPELYPTIHRSVHRALLARFPYGVYYAAHHESISILGVIHTARHPRRWPRV